MKCSKCGYNRQISDDDVTPDWQCPSCGVAYVKAEQFSRVQAEQFSRIPTPPPILPTSAVATLVLLEPRSKGRDLIKVALRELLLRGVFRLHHKRENAWFGRTRDVRRVEWITAGLAPQSLDVATGALAREIYSAVLTDARLERVVGVLRVKYGNDYMRFHRDNVFAMLQAQGLIRLIERKLLGFTWLDRVELTTAGQRQALGLNQQIQYAQGLSPNPDTDQLLRLRAALGPAVVLVPSLWPHLHHLDEATRIDDEMTRMRAEYAVDHTFSFNFRSEDFESLDSVCAVIDDSVDAGDGGDGGGDGGGD